MNERNGVDDDMPDDQELPEEWQRAAQSYHRPPEPPREAMWAMIEARLGGRPPVSLTVARARRTLSSARWLRPALAAAAVLVVGIGIGRMTVDDDGPGRLAESPGEVPTTTVAGDARHAPAVRTAALEHLGRSESLLTLVRLDARSGHVDREVGEWGRVLLAQTRLLLDSPAADDPRLRELLEDLELILAQVALLDRSDGVAGARAREELEIIAGGMEQREVLSRIQAILPVGAEPGMTGI